MARRTTATVVERPARVIPRPAAAGLLGRPLPALEAAHRPGGGARPAAAHPRPGTAFVQTVLGIRPAAARRRTRPRWPRLLLLAVAAYAAITVVQSGIRYAVLARQLAAVSAETARLQREDAQLRAQAAGLQTPAAIADAARQLLGMSGPGDVVFTPVAPGH